MTIIDIADSRKEFVKDVDGYVYYWPAGSTHGCMSAHHLRELADELDRRNKEWDAIVSKWVGTPAPDEPKFKNEP